MVQFILSDADKRMFVLMRENKKDGSLGGTIMLGKHKTPMYEVDGFDNAVYLVSGANIAAYRWSAHGENHLVLKPFHPRLSPTVAEKKTARASFDV